MRLPFALVVLALVPGTVDRTPPSVAGFHVRADGRAFAGDRPLLATISPNGDGFRERAAISFRLSEPARVRITVSKTLREPAVVWVRTGVYDKGRHVVHWAPQGVPARTYLVGLTAVDRAGNRTTLGATSAGHLRRGAHRAPPRRVLGVHPRLQPPSHHPGPKP